MLEIVINNPSDRRGEGIIDTSEAYNGTFCYVKSFKASGETLLDLPVNSSQALRAFHPINKYYYPEDLSDTSDAVDKRTKGDTIVYYTGDGEYITDRFCADTFGLSAEYWGSVEGGLSSAYGAKITSPGTDSAQATRNNTDFKCWVATGNARGTTGRLRCGNGYLIGTSDGTFDTGTNNENAAAVKYVAKVVRIFGSDSADAKIHVRLEPVRFANISPYIPA